MRCRMMFTGRGRGVAKSHFDKDIFQLSNLELPVTVHATGVVFYVQTSPYIMHYAPLKQPSSARPHDNSQYNLALNSV